MSKVHKIARVVACIFIPVLWPMRCVMFLVRRIRRLVYKGRVKRAKVRAIALNIKTGKRYYGVRHGYRVRVYDTAEVKRMNKKAYKPARRMFGPAKVEYRALTIFTVEPNGTTIDK